VLLWVLRVLLWMLLWVLLWVLLRLLQVPVSRVLLEGEWGRVSAGVAVGARALV
jgi:hypothetical protein